MSLLILVFIGILSYRLLRTKPLFKEIEHFFLICIVCFLVISIIRYPQVTFDAAKIGVNTWFNIVLPSLLPFFIGAELLIELGVVYFIGALLEPLARPIFNVPGEGSFILAMSVTSGYPVGVKLVSKFRQEGKFNKIEAQRLLSFCSTSGPLFMIGAVAIGMFHNLQLGSVIVLSHYLGAIATGICFKFYKYKNSPAIQSKTQNRYISRAFREMFSSFQRKQKTFGGLLGSSVKNSVESLLVIGGFIILFSVIIKLLTILGFISFFSSSLLTVGSLFHVKEVTLHAFVSGIFEMTIGCKLLSEIDHLSFIQQAVFSTVLISWSGLSIHAQVASLMSKTDLKVGMYIFSKLLHSFFSAIFVFFAIPVTQLVFQHVHTPVFFNYSKNPIISTWSEKIIFSSELFMFITILVFIFSVLVQIIWWTRKIILNIHKK